VLTNLQKDFTKKCCTHYLKVLIVNASTFKPRNGIQAFIERVNRFVSEWAKVLLIIEVRDEMEAENDNVESNKLVIYQPITSDKVQALYEGVNL
jgi:hypothetical protein